MAQPKSKWKVAIWCGPLLFAGAQFAPGPTPENPPVVPAHAVEGQVQVPAHVARLLERSCKDCHSNATRWPWYSRIAPARWLMASDVEDARGAMNLSEWNPRIGPGLLAAACVDAQSGRMPPRRYILLHPSARLTAEERAQLCEWTRTELPRSMARLRAIWAAAPFTPPMLDSTLPATASDKPQAP